MEKAVREKLTSSFKFMLGGIAGVVGFIASLIAVAAIFGGDLPSYDFYLDCSAPIESRDGFWEAQERIGRFHDFVAQNDGQIVYLSMEVFPSSMAGGCALSNGAWWDEDEDSAKTGYSLSYFDRELLDERFSLESNQAQLIQDFFDDETLLGPQEARIGLVSEVNQESRGYTPSAGSGAWHPEWIHLHLPDPNTIAGKGVYRTERSPFWYFLDGPFVVRLVRHRSVATINISPLSESENYFHDVDCSRKRLEWSFFRRLIPCW